MREYFPSLYGNGQVKKRLGDAVIMKKLPHAFMLAGPSGSGRRTLARELAMALNCESQGTSDLPLPCGVCNTCRRISEGNFTDITHVKREDGKAAIGVDEVRRHRADMSLSPNESEQKVYIIEEADRLTENAQNALLTVLEEPPRSVYIILICESADKILTTIKSRVQAINMQRFGIDELKSAVLTLSESARKISRTNPSLFEGIIMSADGRIGRAISLFSDDEAKKNEEDRQVVLRITDAVCKKLPYKELYSAISDLPKSRTELISALEALVLAVRDLLLLKLDKNAPLLFYTSRDDALSASREISAKRLLSLYESIQNAASDAVRNVGISAITADLAARIRLL